MLSNSLQFLLPRLIACAALLWLTLASRTTQATSVARLMSEVQTPRLLLRYHGGQLLSASSEAGATIKVHVFWYGSFTAAKRGVVADFLLSLGPDADPGRARQPSVWSWWNITRNYNPRGARSASKPNTAATLGAQAVDPKYSRGKSLKRSDVAALVASAVQRGALPKAIKGGSSSLYLVLTAADVAVEGFCMSMCGYHDAVAVAGEGRAAYAWVGNSEKQCPGTCAWPFEKPLVGPQTAPLVAPNADAGLDGMVITVATLLAGAVTDPFDDGGFHDDGGNEAVSACSGEFGPGAFPGYPGTLVTDATTGASFNCYGVNGSRFLVPAMWNPVTLKCTSPLGTI